ncbi:hypothetical protein ACFQVA_16145 [Actinomadura keratinilytica]
MRTEPSRVRDRRGPLLVASAALGLAAIVALAGQAGAGGSVNWLVPLPLFVGAAIGAVYGRATRASAGRNRAPSSPPPRRRPSSGCGPRPPNSCRSWVC